LIVASSAEISASTAPLASVAIGDAGEDEVAGGLVKRTRGSE
jgi:hypothetical protein